MEPDLSKLQFYSGANYMKRSEFCDSTTLTLPAAGSTAYVTYDIDHNLGFIPFYDVYAEVDTAGTIWADGKVSEATEQFLLSGAATPPTYPQVVAWCTTTTLTVGFLNDTSPAATGTRKIYWNIYLDYGGMDG